MIILESVPRAYARVDSGFDVTFVNHATERLFRKSRAELLGAPLWEMYPAESRSPLEAGLRRAMAERTRITIDGLQLPRRAEHSVIAVPDANGGLVVRFVVDTEGKLEAALRKSEEKFCKAFQSSPVAMCIVDIDSNARFLEVNEAFARTTGYSRDELIGHTSTELGLYYDPRVLAQSRQQLLEKGGYRNLEVRFRKKNGDVIIGLISAESIEIDKAFCAIAVAVDVTEERRAQQALRDSEELYRRLFEVESDALLLVDRDSGQLLACNLAAICLYGYSREGLLSKNRVDLSAEPELTVQTTTNLPQNFTPLRWHKKKDGSVFPVEISNCYFDLKGRAVFLSAIRDISDRRLMEIALQKSEEKFHKAFQSNPAAIAISDLTGRKYVDVNGTFQELTGYAREEVIGRSWDELSLWADPRQRDVSFRKLMHEGRLLNREFQYRKKDGTIRTGLVSAELIEIEGRVYAITATIDVTERVRLQSRLQQAEKLESVGRLAGGVAHDFNNLLTIINGYSDSILKASRPSDSIHQYAQEIEKAGMRAAGLTKQLLAFSRKQVTRPRPLDLNVVVSDSERMLRRLIGEDIRLTASLDPRLGQVMADADQMHQVVVNLVVNARDAMPDGGDLNITTSNIDLSSDAVTSLPEAVPGRYVMLAITDSGVGISDETLPNIFEPFFTTKEQGDGTGLGLATVYGIVRQSGGWIEVSSVLGQGSRFCIYLPRIVAGTAEDQPVPAAAAEIRGEETILLVEDQEEVRKYVATILRSYGYQVLESSGAAEASLIAQEHPHDIHILLTDVIMPGMNGKELADRIRRLRPKLKVIFMSGYPADMIARRGVLEQDVAYLPKPFTPNGLAAKIREVLSGPCRSGSEGHVRRRSRTET